MSLGSFFRSMGKRTTDGIVGVASGTTPVKALDSPRAFRLVAIFGLAAVGLSGWLIYHNVTRVTALPGSTNQLNTSSQVASAELEKLKSKDTDGDGISDYDELYASRTSPYLKDSDGDGIADRTEIEALTDPNCPQGKVCEGFRLLTSIVDAKGNLTSEFLRKSLASAGVPQAALDKTDDASLLRIYQQVTNSQAGTNTSAAGGNTNIGSIATNASVANGNTNTATSGLSLAQLESLSSTEIRQLLVQNGIDQATLSGIDDVTLKQIFLESLSANQ